MEFENIKWEFLIQINSLHLFNFSHKKEIKVLFVSSPGFFRGRIAFEETLMTKMIKDYSLNNLIQQNEDTKSQKYINLYSDIFNTSLQPNLKVKTRGMERKEEKLDQSYELRVCCPSVARWQRVRERKRGTVSSPWSRGFWSLFLTEGK